MENELMRRTMENYKQSGTKVKIVMQATKTFPERVYTAKIVEVGNGMFSIIDMYGKEILQRIDDVKKCEQTRY